MPKAIIASYHAHVYYDASTRGAAEALRAEMIARFPEAVYGRWRDAPVGPHPSPSFQVAFQPDLFARIVPWLMLSRGELTIFLHPNTGDPLRDHAERAAWMGRQRALDLDALKESA